MCSGYGELIHFTCFAFIRPSFFTSLLSHFSVNRSRKYISVGGVDYLGIKSQPVTKEEIGKY